MSFSPTPIRALLSSLAMFSAPAVARCSRTYRVDFTWQAQRARLLPRPDSNRTATGQAAERRRWGGAVRVASRINAPPGATFGYASCSNFKLENQATGIVGESGTHQRHLLVARLGLTIGLPGPTLRSPLSRSPGTNPVATRSLSSPPPGVSGISFFLPTLCALAAR